MSDKVVSNLTVAAALAGALSVIAMAPPSVAQELEKCYGISKAGENSCASQAGTHSCAGQSTVDYDGGEWRAVAKGVCQELGGQLQPFQGVGQPRQGGDQPRR